MVKTCCVKNCNIETNITCFRFPTSRLLKRQWIDAIGLSNKLTANSLICIRHFQEDDYDIIRGRPRLKARVIPSVFSELRSSSATPDVEGNSIESRESNVNGAIDDNDKEPLSSVPEDRQNLIKNSNRLTNNDIDKSVKDTGEKLDDGKEIKKKNDGVDKGDKDKDRIDNDCDKNDDSNRRDDDVDKSDRRKKCKPNGVISNSLVKSTPPTSSSVDDLNKDIEEIITNYQIKQTRPVHNVEVESRTEAEEKKESNADVENSVEEVPQSDPVFIEVSVQGKGDRAGSPRDCLMVLESVQVELDPSSFLTADGQHPDEDCHETVDLDDLADEDERARSPQDPISLLTSSDEDEVIIQEPHIDTVEVSDETDEDDLPLVKLLKRSKKKDKAIWKTFFYCMACQYTTSSSVEYQQHVSKHSTVLHVCQICDYTTASKTQFARHKRKHKDEKKYKCHLCDYKARHNMSLIYHLKSHRAVSSAKKGLKCDKCGFKSDVKSVVLKHVKLCSSNVKKYSCEKCVYETKRVSDLKRHIARRHTQDDDDDVT